MNSRLAIVLLLTCLVATVAAATDCWDYSLNVDIDPIPMPPGYQRSMAAGPDHLYVLTSNPPGLVVLDAHQPWAPTIVHTVDELPPDSGWVFVRGDLLFITGGSPNTIHVFSLDDPLVPAYLATVDHGGSNRVFEYREPYLYTINDENELLVYDLTDPAAPSLAASPLAEHSFRAGTIVDDHLYLARIDKIVVCRLDAPLAPVIVDEVEVRHARYFARSGDVLYAASSQLLVSMDVSDPAAPDVLYHDPSSWPRSALAVVGDNLLVQHDSEVWLFDTSDPAAPQRLWELPVDGWVSGFLMDSGHLYLMYRVGGTGESVLAIRDLVVPLYPYRSMLEIEGSAEGVDVQGNLAYFATGSGLSIVDITDGDAPVERSQLTVSETSHWYDDITAEWPWVVLAESQFDPVFLIDVTDPYQPLLADSLDLGQESINDIVLHDGFLYVATWANLRAYEIANGEFQLRGTQGYIVYDVEPMGDFLLALTTSLLHVFEISNPGQLDWIAAHDMQGATVIAALGTTLVTLGGPLRLWNMVDPTEPVLLGSIEVSGQDLALGSTTAYVVDQTTGMDVVDVTDPSTPELLGSTPNNGWFTGIDLSDGAVVIAERLGHGHCWLAWPHCDGIVSLEEVDPDELPLPLALSLSAAPSPFNPRTSFHFDLPAATTVTIDIFDPRGHLIRKLVAGQRFVAGTHRIEWNARDDEGRGLSSGTYLARITTGKGRQAVTKVALVR